MSLNPSISARISAFLEADKPGDWEAGCINTPAAAKQREAGLNKLFPGIDMAAFCQMRDVREVFLDMIDDWTLCIDVWNEASQRMKACFFAFIIAGYIAKCRDVESWLMCKLVPLLEPLKLKHIPQQVSMIDATLRADRMSDLFDLLVLRVIPQLPAKVQRTAEAILREAVGVHYKWASKELAKEPRAERKVVHELIRILEESDERSTDEELQFAAERGVNAWKWKHRDSSPRRV